ncbi:hypothetical protein PSH54_12510 [Pseudoalteromonas sp. Angola-30]|uniref:hypothetical protein n=1 Tax=Pseudoalteromonas sp. Angola-30 TaxID=3025341 RepID=UPI0023585334|nr:hypothetical protein [Pseudoalteromonas sp. Angola-30]MDC9519888.1 hypothetical protein [Pseudoalteromonas sp. Angola-31]MDC9526312.1 hypothetical protein [Pseudoalteromonas sp. Angola-30]
MKEKGDSKIYTNCNIITLNIHQEKKEEDSHPNYFFRRLVGNLVFLCLFCIELLFSSWFGSTVYPHIVSFFISKFPAEALSTINYLLILIGVGFFK